MKDKVISMLTSLDVLKSFSAEEINARFFKRGLAKIVQYDAEETIIHEGQYDSWVYWLIDGQVKVIKNGIVIASFQRVGDMFGEMGILDGEARSATVQAAVQTTCFELDMSVLERPELKNKISRESFCRSIAQLTKGRLAKTTRRLSDVEKELVELKKLLMESEEKRQAVMIAFQELIKKIEDKNQKIRALSADLAEKENELNHLKQKIGKE